MVSCFRKLSSSVEIWKTKIVSWEVLQQQSKGIPN